MNWTKVVAGIVFKDRKVLVVQRPEHKVLAGYCEFPGGKVKPGEPLDTALIRELKEELAVVPEKFFLWQKKRVKYEHIWAELYFFIVFEFSGQPKPMEGQNIFWASPKNLDEEKFLPADRDILMLLREELYGGGLLAS
ncbi:(deoxy)nucleoside triphosphate pyrophosphohydrolase [Desulfovulcanus sp.]